MKNHLDTIRRYYDGCNTADKKKMESTFAENVVHYFVDHSPVRGRTRLAEYWAKVGPMTHAHWEVDHSMVQGEEAVIEWSMRWTPVGSAVSPWTSAGQPTSGPRRSSRVDRVWWRRHTWAG